MPLYEYQCRQCGHRFEVIQKFSDAPLSQCEKCGGAVEKLLSVPGLQFKGSGFYITDYARKTEAKKPEGPTTEKPAASTDSKQPAPAVPPKPSTKS